MVKTEFKQSEVGTIPKEWSCCTINQKFTICNNLRLPISDYERKKIQGKYPYWGPTRIQDYINQFQLEGIYALIGEDGDHFLKYKYQSMTQLTSGKFNVNNHAHIIKGNSDIETKWFYYFFKNRNITPYISRQGAGRYKLNKATLEILPIAIPPIEEQTKIIEIISDIDYLISSFEKLIEKKKVIKHGTIQKYFNNQETNTHLLKDICEKITKGTTPTSIGKTFTDRGINFVKIECIEKNGQLNLSKMGHIDEDTNELLKRSELYEGDILFSIAGALGKIAMVNADILPANTNQALAIIRLKKSYKYMHNFLFQYLNADIVKKHIGEINVIGAQPNLSLENIRNIKIPILNSDVITEIGEQLKDMDSEITSIESKLSKYRKIKEGMMQELLTGRIRLM